MDRLGGNVRTVHGHELPEWERFCMMFNASDVGYLPNVFKDEDMMRFSKSNGSRKNVILSRLDRFDVSEAAMKNG